MKVYESGLALLDSEIRTKVTVFNLDVAPAGQRLLISGHSPSYSQYPCFTGCVHERAKKPENAMNTNKTPEFLDN